MYARKCMAEKSRQTVPFRIFNTRNRTPPYNLLTFISAITLLSQSSMPVFSSGVTLARKGSPPVLHSNTSLMTLVPASRDSFIISTALFLGPSTKKATFCALVFTSSRQKRRSESGISLPTDTPIITSFSFSHGKAGGILSDLHSSLSHNI